MNAISTSKIVTAGALVVFTVVSGVLLTRAGRPYNTIGYNVHKLIAVGMIALLVVTTVRMIKAGAAFSPLGLALMVAAAILFLALIATGGMLSFEREWPAVVVTLHRMAPLFSLAASAAGMYLLAGV